MNGWKRSGRGNRVRLVATLEMQEVAVLRGLIEEVKQILAARTESQPADELEELTGLRTGSSQRPDDRVLARLLPDFARDDNDLSGAMRSLHEPELIDAKDAAATVVLETLPEASGRVELTVDQADAWLTALNDVRLALGTALDVSEDLADDLPSGDPRGAHLGVYHWLTYIQDALVQSRMRLG